MTHVHIIDCDAQPSLSRSLKWKIERHIKNGKIFWDTTQVSLHSSLAQHLGNFTRLRTVWAELEKSELGFCNHNVLEFLLQNPHMIPKDWEDLAKEQGIRQIYFWGTIFKNEGGGWDPYMVACLCYEEGSWFKQYYSLCQDAHPHAPAAVHGVVTHCDIPPEKRRVRYDLEGIAQKLSSWRGWVPEEIWADYGMPGLEGHIFLHKLNSPGVHLRLDKKSYADLHSPYPSDGQQKAGWDICQLLTDKGFCGELTIEVAYR